MKDQILSQKQKYESLKDNLSPVLKHGFLRSEENVNLNKFQHLMVYEYWCAVITTKADVVPL